jgi:hypothetical protein
VIVTRGFGDSQLIVTRGYGTVVSVGRYITLHVSEVTAVHDGYGVTLTIVDATPYPRELFVFQRKPATVGAVDVFSHVASPSSIEELPIGAPVETTFFRLSTASFVFRSLQLLDQSLVDIKRELCILVEELERMEELQQSIVSV